MSFKEKLKISFQFKVIEQFDKILKERVFSDCFDLVDQEKLLIEVLKLKLKNDFLISEQMKQKNEKKEDSKEQKPFPYGEFDENGEVVTVDFKLEFEVEEYLQKKKEREEKKKRKESIEQKEVPISFIEGENTYYNMNNEFFNLFKSVPRIKKVNLKSEIEFYENLIRILTKYNLEIPISIDKKYKELLKTQKESINIELTIDSLSKKKKGQSREDKRFLKKIQSQIFPIEKKEAPQIVSKNFEPNITKEMIIENKREFELVFQDVINKIKEEKKLKIHEILKFRDFFKKKYFLEDSKVIDMISNSNIDHFIHDEYKLNDFLLKEMKIHFQSHSDSLEKILNEIYPMMEFKELILKSYHHYEWYLKSKREDEHLEKLKNLILGKDDQIPEINLSFEQFLSYIQIQIEKGKSSIIFDSQQQEIENIDWLLDQSNFYPPNQTKEK